MISTSTTWARSSSCTNAGLDWVAEHIPEDAQKFGVAFVVEHRFIRNVVAGAMRDGLKVS